MESATPGIDVLHQGLDWFVAAGLTFGYHFDLH